MYWFAPQETFLITIVETFVIINIVDIIYFKLL